MMILQRVNNIRVIYFLNKIPLEVIAAITTKVFKDLEAYALIKIFDPALIKYFY